MSGFHVHIIDNSKGSNDKVAVIIEGDLVYNGERLGGKQLMELFETVNGFEFLRYHQTDDQGMANPEKVAYPDV